METNSCRYDREFSCFKFIKKCPYSSLLSCLKTSTVSQARELDRLRHRQMQKHSEASLQWRNSSFYYKKKCKQLEEWLVKKGLKVPSSEELKHLAKSEGEVVI